MSLAHLGMPIGKLRAKLADGNRQYPVALVKLPRESWPSDTVERRIAVWRSRGFLVQAVQESDGIVRLSINRTAVKSDFGWEEGISWDELQRLKAEAGYGDRFAVEIYPADSEVVNVANLRHLWILPEAPAFAWRRK